MFNELTIIGHLGKDPEVRATNGGKEVANFTVATTHSFKVNGQKQEETEWHSVVVFNGLVSVAQQYLHKGDTVFIKGRLRTRKWQDQNGQDHYKTEVICNELKMLGSKQAGQNQQQAPQQAQQPQQSYQQQPAQQSQQPVQQQRQQAPQQNYHQQQPQQQQQAQPQVQQQAQQAPQQYQQQPQPQQAVNYQDAKEPLF